MASSNSGASGTRARTGKGSRSGTGPTSRARRTTGYLAPEPAQVSANGAQPHATVDAVDQRSTVDAVDAVDQRSTVDAVDAVDQRSTVDAVDQRSTADEIDQWVASALRFLRRRLTGDYDVDEFGFDPQLTEALWYPPLRLLYQRYFRVECLGVEHLPRDGAALLVANHSGTVPIDALMLTLAIHDETPKHRHLRLLGADLVFRMPVLSELARKTGATLACNPDAERLLRRKELVGVFPEGFKGIGKAYRDRYRLQRFGRGGFVAAALRTRTPIVPVAIVGAEEIYPLIGDVRPLAKLIGLPYLPLTPLFPWFGPLGLLPLPSKWFIAFGEPIETTSYAGHADDPLVVFNLADQVRETIQQTLVGLLARRPDPFG